MFGWIIGIVLVVVLVIALGRGGILQKRAGSAVGSDTGSSAMETLKNRYAKGEIDQAEYEEKKTELERTN